MIKNFVFDCWSTLLLFKPKFDNWTHKALLNHALNKNDIDEKQIDLFVKKFFNDYYSPDVKYEIDNIHFFNLLIDRFNIKIDAPISSISEETFFYLDNKAVDNVNDFLSLLKHNNYSLAVASNTMYSNKKTKELINKFIVADFDDVITSNTYGVRKPYKEFFEATMCKLNYHLNETIYIGDSPIEDCYGPYSSNFKGAILVLNSHKDPSVLQNKINPNTNFKYRIYNNYIELINDYSNMINFFND